MSHEVERRHDAADGTYLGKETPVKPDAEVTIKERHRSAWRKEADAILDEIETAHQTLQGEEFEQQRQSEISRGGMQLSGLIVKLLVDWEGKIKTN